MVCRLWSVATTGTRWRHGRARRPRHGFTRVRSRVLDPPLGASCTQRNGCRHGKNMKMRRYPRLSCSSAVGFCTVIRGAFCIVPVQASGIFGQVPLACACHSLVRLPCCSRSCAHPLAAAHSPLSALEPSLSRVLTRPLATLYLPLSHLHLSLQSHSLNRTLTPEHALFIGHSLPFLVFHPPTFPLGTAPCTA